MKKYSIIILILCSWAMSLFAISCSDQESKPQPFLEKIEYTKKIHA